MYRRIRSTVVLVLLSLISMSWAEPAVRDRATAQRQSASEPRSIEVYFSPDGGCTDAIISRLSSAQQTIDIQAYSFTSAPIAKAVSDAHKRGVKVRVILDKSQRTARYTSATYLFNQGVPVFIDDKHAIAHNKIMLIDGQTIITGSFNFSKSAEERNAENLLIISGYPELMEQYAANFGAHLSHTAPYSGMGKSDDSEGE